MVASGSFGLAQSEMVHVVRGQCFDSARALNQVSFHCEVKSELVCFMTPCTGEANGEEWWISAARIGRWFTVELRNETSIALAERESSF